ncbi:M20/M25/M40 family metallo-hydrolase [Colwellia polaris]|jgi:aminopeptidase YwaD|uniref:M20/M25/M40 family metallo-hydrolase n=1 Tax=Colwellia polaris TaxID=326537 RepID=UPI000A174261|nr:M20/M25/M40 family metallo-hydrolase [Colwellia polaris]|tara:strand:- start:4537 stop:5901 length:1365 start_codon:yes stop_codon:yes gene_type:complete
MTKTMMKKLKFIPKKKQHSTLKTVLVSLLITSSFYTTAEIIPSEQVIKDITYLASDDLKGRASFSPEIDKAANYIAKRFAEIGLQPLHSESFLQTFTVSQIQPNTLSVNLNGEKISPKNTAIASTIEKLEWDSNVAQVHIINKDDDMRTALRELNQQGGQHLIVIDNSHKKTFKAYQGYFNRGLTKLSLEHSGALVLVLRDDNSVESKIEQYKVSASATITQQTLTNVVGVLPGKQSPEDIVLYSSHYDHLGVTEDGKQIYNGADDDASGTTAVLNLAQFFANKGDNKRSLMFSAFTAEEIGGFGSKYFSQQLNPDHVVAMINIEMIGKPSKFGAGTIWMTGMERSNLGELLNKNLVEINTKIYQDPYPEQGLFYRSDNATLARLGVPAHSFSSTQLDKDQHYHKVTDDINSLDLSSMHKVIETLATATQPLVDGLATPTRIDKAQVRSTGKIY